MEAYDGNGNLLEGEWSYEWDGAAGGMLVLTVPEPAAFAAALGAVALAFALRGRAGRCPDRLRGAGRTEDSR